MLHEQKIAKEQATAFVGHTTAEDLQIGNSKIGIAIIMSMAGFVGIWGCICLLNGIAQTHNIHEFGRGIITALTGI